MVERWRDDGPEVAEGDLTEQHRGVVDDPDESEQAVASPPDGVDPADAQEQQLAVQFDEDDYR